MQQGFPFPGCREARGDSSRLSGSRRGLLVVLHPSNLRLS